MHCDGFNREIKRRLQVLDLSFLIFYARWPPLSTSWHWSTQLQANRIRSVAVHPGAWEVRAGRGSNRWAQFFEVRHSRILLKILSSSAPGFVVQIWLSRVWRGSKAEPKLIKKCFEASLPGSSTSECFHQLPWLSFKSALPVVKVWFQFTALQCTYMSKSMVLLRTSSINFLNELTSWSTQTMDLLPRWPWRMHGWLSKILVRMQMICRNSLKMTSIGTNLSIFAQSLESSVHRLDCRARSSEFTCVPTEDLLARSRQQAEGIWYSYKSHAKGYVVYSRTSMYRLTGHYMSRTPVDRQFNIWYQTEKSEGWVACGGQCAGNTLPVWYNVTKEDPPFVTKQLARCIGCIGYCRTARKHQAKGWRCNCTISALGEDFNRLPSQDDFGRF